MLLKTPLIVLSVLTCGLCVAGCSATPPPHVDAGAVRETLNGVRKRSTPVVAERPARMYIWAGFNEKDCSPITPKLAVSLAPSKGTVTFRAKQTTTIKQSNSGKCIGHRMTGTGIYYTARQGETGTDQFSVLATTVSGQTVTRAFEVQISE